jgi:hypothetical protein
LGVVQTTIPKIQNSNPSNPLKKTKVGEAPDEVRNVCRQRSRWTKGHMQVFFSRRCPLLNGRLPLVHRWCARFFCDYTVVFGGTVQSGGGGCCL